MINYHKARDYLFTIIICFFALIVSGQIEPLPDHSGDDVDANRSSSSYGFFPKPLLHGNIYASIVPTYCEGFIVITGGLNGSLDFGDLLFLDAQYQIGYAVYPSFGFDSESDLSNEDYRSITTIYNNNYADVGLKMATSYGKPKVTFDMGKAEDLADLHTYGKIRNGTIVHSFNVTFGMGIMQRPVNRDDSQISATDTAENNPINDIYYRAVNLNNTEFRFGFEYRMDRARFKDGKWRRRYIDETVVYFKLLVPVKSNLEVYRYKTDIFTYSSSPVLVTQGYVEPEFTSSGFILGAKFASEDSGFKTYFTLESGVFPGIDYDNYLGNLYISLSIGMGFGNVR